MNKKKKVRKKSISGALLFPAAIAFLLYLVLVVDPAMTFIAGKTSNDGFSAEFVGIILLLIFASALAFLNKKLSNQ